MHLFLFKVMDKIILLGKNRLGRHLHPFTWLGRDKLSNFCRRHLYFCRCLFDHWKSFISKWLSCLITSLSNNLTRIHCKLLILPLLSVKLNSLVPKWVTSVHVKKGESKRHCHKTWVGSRGGWSCSLKCLFLFPPPPHPSDVLTCSNSLSDIPLYVTLDASVLLLWGTLNKR